MVSRVADCEQLLRPQTVTLRVHGQLKPLERKKNKIKDEQKEFHFENVFTSFSG